MSEPIRGRRDSFSDEWRWEPVGDSDGSRGLPRRSLVLIGLAVVLLFAALGLLLLANDGGGSSPANGPSGSPSARTFTPSEPTQSPEKSPVEPTASGRATPTATETAGGPTLALFAWSRREARWIEGELPAASGFREGDSIPVMLLVEGGQPGKSYNAGVLYQCATETGAAIDFLTSPGETDAVALLTPPAPAGRADSTVSVPDDPSIRFDDGDEGRFQLWGGTFQRSPEGTLTPDTCSGAKSIKLAVRAAGDTISLVWGLHLASAEDWGEGRGFASGGETIVVSVAVEGTGETRVGVAVGAVAH